MKILVPVKRVIDPNIPVRIDESGKDVVRQNIPHAMNPFDEVAVGLAASMRASGVVDELIAVSIGPDKAAETLRTALAMGADRALHIVTNDTDQLPPFDIARILQKICKEEQPDLVLMGKQAIDSDAGQTPALLAGFLNLPFLPDCTSVQLERDKVLATFDLNGATTSAKATLPAIASCELHLFEPLPISLPQMMKSKQKPLTSTPLADLQIELSGAVKTLKLTEPVARPPCRLFENAGDLAAQLKQDGILK